MRNIILLLIVIIAVFALSSCDGQVQAPGAITDNLFECKPSINPSASDYYNTYVCEMCDVDPLARPSVGGPISQNVHASTNSLSYGRCGNSALEGDHGSCTLNMFCNSNDVIQITSGAEGVCLDQEIDVCCRPGQIRYIFGDLCGYENRGPGAKEQICVPSEQCFGRIVNEEPQPSFRKCMSGAVCCETNGQPTAPPEFPPPSVGPNTRKVNDFGGSSCYVKCNPVAGENTEIPCSIFTGNYVNILGEEYKSDIFYQLSDNPCAGTGSSNPSGACSNGLYYMSGNCLSMP